MKRSRIKPRSKKRVQRMKEAMPIRLELIEEAGNVCMYCGHGPGNPNRDMPAGMSRVDCHEILNGPLRDKTLDEPCSLLVLCFAHNAGDFHRKQLWPPARQLALLLARSPHRYDLERFNWLRNPNAPDFVTQEEVDEYIPQFLETK